MKKIRWGVLGAGLIAGKLAKAINEVDDAVLYAVGSRDVTKAKIFAGKFGAQKFFSSYEALCACEDVDVIYVATPHVFHKEHTLLALEKGKHVLCEKPFAVNSGEAEAMLATARRQQLFVMEAMWTCVMPGIKKLKTLIEGGVI
ncbi:MAG: Gfo/Idh/MocA family oxidoreductase, partial [Lentisphaeraceae bacterium]|nr:Gfo/Idh/MocA family oxidoreductase [Lentisphaeraceae bacterium]